MTNPQKRKGSAAERAVADYLNSQGIVCERIPAGANQDRGDLWVPEWPTIDVKNCQRTSLAEWVDRAIEQAQNAKRHAGIVWHKRRGNTSPADWYVTTNGAMFLQIMEATRER